ncbi:MAG: hypothetical protein K2P95_04730 [Hyphomonadaceae bacterium]|nr:hypothetical protein [Hyphomonadaceae bacterium]
MSKAMKALAKLARSQADEIQRDIAVLERREDALRAQMRARLVRIAEEEQAAKAGAAFAAVSLAPYLALERKRQTADETACAALRQEADALRETLAAAFREAKKLETLLEERWNAERKELTRRQQAAADDRAAARALAVRH